MDESRLLSVRLGADAVLAFEILVQIRCVANKLARSAVWSRSSVLLLCDMGTVPRSAADAADILMMSQARHVIVS